MNNEKKIYNKLKALKDTPNKILQWDSTSLSSRLSFGLFLETYFFSVEVAFQIGSL